MERQQGKLVGFLGPMGEGLFAEEFVLRWDDHLDGVRSAYRDRVRVSVDLTLLPPEDAKRSVDELDELVSEDQGELWQVDGRLWLLTPRRPREIEPEPDPGGPWPSGDREPRIPSGPIASGAASLPLPDGEAWT